MRPAKLRFAFPLPQPPPEQTQPLPQKPCLRASKLQGNSFTPSPVVKRWPPQRLPVQPQKNPPIPLTPRAAAPAAACMAGRSRGQHMLPQQPSKQTATAPPLNLCRSQAPLGNASREALLRIPAPAIAPETNTAPAARRACLSIDTGAPGEFFHTLSCGQALAPATAPSPTAKESPNPPNPSCCRSCGGMRGWPLPRPTHAPATALKTNGNSAPIKPMSFPSSAWECVPRSSASHSRSRNRPRNKHSPRRKAGLPSHREAPGEFFHTLRSGHSAPCHHGSGWHEGVGFCFFFGGCSGVGSGSTMGFWFPVWRILSHPLRLGTPPAKLRFASRPQTRPTA